MSIEPLGSRRPQLRQLGPYTFHADPSHGWLEVPFDDVYLLGIGNDLSKLSYMSADGKTLYLEEDSDYVKFARAWKVMVLDADRRLSATLVGEELHTRGASAIRDLEPLDWVGCLIKYSERLRDAAGGVYNTTSDAEHDPTYDY